MGTSAPSDLFGTSAAPTALTANYVGGGTIGVGGDFNQATLYMTIAGFDAASIEFKVQFYNGVAWCDELTEEVAAGIVTQLTAVRSPPAANGTYAILVPLPAVTHMRVAIKRTGGTNATTCWVCATFGQV